MYPRAVTLCAALLLAAAAAPAADDAPKSGLKEGADLPGPFRPFNVTGAKYKDKFHCLTNEHGLNPAVLVFAQNPALDTKDQFVELLRQVDDYIVKRPKTRLAGFAVFLFNDLPDVVKDDDARAARADELTKLANSDPPLKQVVLALDDGAKLQKAGYDLDPKDQVVVVLYDQLKVRKVYKFDKPLTAADVKAVMTYVTETLAPFKK